MVPTPESARNLIGGDAERFAAIERLGEGAEGGTWTALDTHQGRRKVVLKFVARERAGHVRRAFSILRRVSSPHLPAALELLNQEDGGAWLVSDWIPGAPIPAVTGSIDAALEELTALVHALRALHGVGTHHGDVSLGNVIRTPAGELVLIDFGQLGCFGCGTPGFLAPEVLAGGGGAAADVFALGCLVCARLFGQVPWSEPAAVARLRRRGRADVRARLDELVAARDGEQPPRGLLVLLEHMLDPDPARRIVDLELVARHVARLRRDRAQDEPLAERAVTWWLPSRWPYRGPSLDGLIRELLGEAPPRLIAIAGPDGAGRARVVEELITGIQVAATAKLAAGERCSVAARLCAAEELGHAFANRHGGAWLAAWMSDERPGPRAPDRELVGCSGALAWPGELAAPSGEEASETLINARAVVLRGAAEMARATLVVPVSVALGDALARELDEGAPVRVWRVRPWDRVTLQQALDGVLELDEHPSDDELLDRRGEWDDALFEVTGGWPGRVVEVVAACARDDIQRPDPQTLAEAVAAGGPTLDPGLARLVIEASWRTRAAEQTSVAPAAAPPARLAGAFASDGSPLPWALAAARVALGPRLPAMARERLSETTGPVNLALALDADASAQVEAWLLARSDRPSSPAELRSRPWPALDRSRLTRWIQRGGAAQISDRALAVLVRYTLRIGQTTQALELARLRPGQSSARCQLLAAKALEQMGRAPEALQALAAVLDAGSATPSQRARALGLRWRALADLGRAAEAVAEASAWTETIGADGSGAGQASATSHAEALLWAALAALYDGDEERAEAWLARAEERLDAVAAPEREAASVHGVRARVEQLQGNLVHMRGQLAEAARRYEQAARWFARAGEAVGSLLLVANLAALALLSGDLERGLGHGRAAFRGQLASGRLQALPAISLNLVQLLSRASAVSEARRVARIVRRVVGAASLGAVAEARLARLEADVALADQRARGVFEPSLLPALSARFSRSAEQLHTAGCAREAVSAWLRSAALARQRGALDEAAGALAAARAGQKGLGEDDDDELEITLETLALSAKTGDRAGFDRAGDRLRLLAQPAELRRTGRLELAWRYDLTLWQALRDWIARPAGQNLGRLDQLRRAVVRRMHTTLEMLMNKVDRLEQPAAHAARVAEAGEPGAIGALIADLDGGQSQGQGQGQIQAKDASPRARAPEPDTGSRGRASQGRQLRVYRRLAREDDLERLMGQVVDAMMELCDAERGVVVLKDGFAPEGCAHEVARELAAGSDGVDFSRSIVARVLAEGQPILSLDAVEDDRFDGSRSVSHLNLRSVLAVPLVFRGERIGAAYVDHRLRRGAFDERDLAEIEAFVDLASLAIAHARTLAVQRSQAQELKAQGEELARLLEERENEVRGLREEVRAQRVAERKVYRGMVGGSSAMQAVFRLIDRLADSDVPVVIYGESGTGKELVARAVHTGGPRKNKPFVAENCGAIPETLLESVLFGHAKGAFTGAHRASTGLFEAADGGTIFLDEIGEMSPLMQTKLLRVLQEGVVRRVGETRPRTIDVRVIAASNRNLDDMVAAGTFRQDLYYRVQVVKVELPPLRMRTEDLGPLIEHFLARYDTARRLTVSAAAMRGLARYPWPGNVRELENEVQRWVVLADKRVEPGDLSPAINEHDAEGDIDPDDLRLRPRLERLERQVVARALERAGGNQTRAAELLGLSRYGLQKKLRRHAEADAAGGEADGDDDAGAGKRGKRSAKKSGKKSAKKKSTSKRATRKRGRA